MIKLNLRSPMTYRVTISDEIISEETGHRQDDVMDTSEELSWLLAPGMSTLCLKKELSFQLIMASSVLLGERSIKS